MNRKVLLWLSAAAVLAVLVAYQTLGSSAARRAESSPRAPMSRRCNPAPMCWPALSCCRQRTHRYDYRRAAFGDAWDDDNDAPGGHNGCDTRDDILNRDLVDKTYVSIKRCPDAVATGTLHDPYTNATIAFQRGAKVGESVQIDHIVPLAYAWDMGAYGWPDRRAAAFRQRSGQPAGRRRARPIRTRVIRRRRCGCRRTARSRASTRCSSSPCCAVISCR